MCEQRDFQQRPLTTMRTDTKQGFPFYLAPKRLFKRKWEFLFFSKSQFIHHIHLAPFQVIHRSKFNSFSEYRAQQKHATQDQRQNSQEGKLKRTYRRAIRRTKANVRRARLSTSTKYWNKFAPILASPSKHWTSWTVSSTISSKGSPPKPSA